MSRLPNSSEPDKGALYGVFERTQRWKDNLSRKLAHKALDIPDDELDIRVNHGFGWREILALGAVGGAMLWGALQMLPEEAPPAVPPVEQNSAIEVTGTIRD